MRGVGQARWQCYRRHQENPQPCPNSVVLAGEKKIRKQIKEQERKKETSTLSHVLEGRGWVTGRSGLRLWLQLRNTSRGCRWFFSKKELIRLWNSILSEPGQPSAQLSKLIRPTECRKTQHSMSRWHRTVHIPWLVDSHDTHKSKRWLNSNPQTTGETTAMRVWSIQTSLLVTIDVNAC